MNNILIHYLSYLFIFLILFEIVLQITIHFLKKDFQWLITKKDEFPISDQSQLDEFIKKNFPNIRVGNGEPIPKATNI